MWALDTCGAWPPNETKKNTRHPNNITARCAGHFLVVVLLVEVVHPSATRTPCVAPAARRSIAPRWGSIRCRLAPRTYAPWGCIARVVSRTKSRKRPARGNVTALFYFQDAHLRRFARVGPRGGKDHVYVRAFRSSLLTRGHTVHGSQGSCPRACVPQFPARGKKGGSVFPVGVLLDFVWLATRTMHPHGAYAW